MHVFSLWQGQLPEVEIILGLILFRYESYSVEFASYSVWHRINFDCIFSDWNWLFNFLTQGDEFIN